MTEPKLEALQEHFPGGAIIIHRERPDQQVEVFCVGLKDYPGLDDLFERVKALVDSHFNGSKEQDNVAEEHD